MDGRDTLRLLLCTPAGIEWSRRRRRRGCSCARGAEGGRDAWRQLLEVTSRSRMRAEAATSRVLLVCMRRRGWARHVEVLLWAPAGIERSRRRRRGCCSCAGGAVGGRDTWRQLLVGTSRWQMRAEGATSRLHLVCTRRRGWARHVEVLRWAPAGIERSRRRRRRGCSCARGTVGGRDAWRPRCLWAPAGGKCEPRLLRRG